MAILNNSNAISSGGYDINNSLRFRSSASAYLNRTPASAGNRQIFTISVWVKRGTLGSDYKILSAYSADSDSGLFDLRFSSANVLYIGNWNTGLTTTAVFRDPSAWYHIVLAVDTTQATGSNRIKAYVNGVQYTLNGTAFDQNVTTPWNNNVTQNIGRQARTSDGYFDGYMAEFYNVDGQALTPSSFGETDATTGSWVAKKYTGTYGTNGFYLPFKMNNSTSSYAGSFNGSSQYLSSSTALFNYTTANASTQTATIEAMVYLNSYQTPSQVYYSPCIAGKGDVYMNLGVNGSGNLIFYHYDGTARTITGSSVIPLNTWTYVAVTISGGTATIYVNGTSVGSGTWYGIQAAGQSSTSYFGRPATSGSALYLNGYISNLRVSSIARTISTPATSYSNDANTNFLTLQSATVVDNSTNAYAITNTGTVTTSVSYPFYTTSVSADYSGNANNWTSNNINVASSGTTYDAMIDSPTLTSATVANYCVFSPLWTGSPTLSNGNLQITSATTSQTAIGSMAANSGKFYFEYQYTSSPATNGGGGVWDINSAFSAGGVPDSGTGARYVPTSGNIVKFINGSATTVGTYATYTSGDIIGVGFDCDAGTVSFYKNNTLQVTITDSNFISKFFAPCMYVYTGNVAANFGQRPFSYTPPTGFVRLNTFNLPDSTIKKGNTNFDVLTYTGNGATSRSFTGLSFQPDLIWNKDRTTAYSHRIVDSVRGVRKELYSNTTDQELDQWSTYGSVNSFDTNGYTITTGGTAGNFIANLNGDAQVAWIWKASGSTSSNTSGTITSTVSVNATAGFSVVTWAGSGAAGTVGHGLGVTPAMIITKNRTSGSTEWVTWHKSLSGATNTDGAYIYLNSTGAASTTSIFYNGSQISSSVFGLRGNNINVNASSNNYVAYCWAEIAGFSKFGSYTGNGSIDGPFVYLGFRPKFIIFKRADGVGGWLIDDSMRDTFNYVDLELLAHSSDAEAASGSDFSFDYLSNGFKVRRLSSSSLNVNAATIIYMAFAENPFKNSNAR